MSPCTSRRRLLLSGAVFPRHARQIYDQFGITQCACAHTPTQIIAGCFSHAFSYGREGTSRARARGATSTSALKRSYRNQSITRNNGFVKTTFHRPPPGGHVVSPAHLPVSGPGQQDGRAETSCTSELSKGCLHVASYDVLDENNSLGYHVGRDVGETKRERERGAGTTSYPSRVFRRYRFIRSECESR